MSRKSGKRRQEETRESGLSGDPAQEVIWGVNSVFEALSVSPRSISEILVQRGKGGPKLQGIVDLARQHKIRLRFVEANRLGLPARCKHQGVVARQSPVSLLTLDDILEKIEALNGRSPVRLLLLDSIQDPRNLGAILRSALAAGFTFVIMTRERSAPLTGTVAKTSAGAVSYLDICQVANLADTIKVLKQRGLWLFGAVADKKALSVYAADFSLPLGLVIGSEGKGIRPLVQKQCDHLITIPIQGQFDSLNASVAASVIMFEVVRQQQATGIGNISTE